MANNINTPKIASFEVPEGTIDLITWQYVLDQLDVLLESTLDKLETNNTHLENIANTLESWANVEG